MSDLPPFGTLLRTWRGRRGVSQLELASRTDVSARHVSFVETGRATPSREMVLRLAGELELPLRERNALLQAAGHAPEYPVTSPAAPDVAAAVQTVLDAQLPFPAAAVDRGWNLVAANAALPRLLAGAAPSLLEPPVNVLRLSLHPDGLASSILNLAQWRGAVLGRLEREIAVTADAALVALHRELSGYPGGRAEDAGPGLALPLRLRFGGAGGADLAFLSTVTTFGTARDVTLAELSIEAFLPADEATAAFLAGA